MSNIFGIFNRNGKSVEKKTVDIMLDAMSYWKPDDKGVWIDGSVALGHAMLWNTPESKYEHLPLQQDAYILTMDARIDNRDELLEQLELPNRPILEIGDSEFILSAYKKWGEECPKHLLGDFAFAIWDEKKKQLFCARDHVGVKQLYYHVIEELFIFGNDLKGLLENSKISKKINDDVVANYFVHDQLNSRTLTFFSDVMKLPPAHTLIITSTKIEINCYWELKDTPSIKLSNQEDYVKKLRELLNQSVQARLRSAFPVASHLSGGLDSSTIAVIAARNLNKKNERLIAFNWLHNPSENDDLLHFEWYNSASIAQVENIDHHYVTLTSKDVYKYIRKRDIVYGETVGFWYEYSVRKSAQMKGSRTILSGWGGDQFITYRGKAYYSNLVWNGKIIQALQGLNNLANKKVKKNIKTLISFFYHRVLVAFVPSKLYCYLPKINCFGFNNSYPMIKKDFLTPVNDTLKKISFFSNQGGKTIREDMLKNWSNGMLQTRIESWASESITNRLEYVYPMLDKRIIEFMLGVPIEYLVKDDEGRYLFRLAVKDLLPHEILWMGKEDETNRVNYYLSLLIAVYKKLLKNKDLDYAKSKYIDKDIFIQMLENLDEETLFSKFLQIDASVSILLSQVLSPQERNP